MTENEAKKIWSSLIRALALLGDARVYLVSDGAMYKLEEIEEDVESAYNSIYEVIKLVCKA